MVYVHVPSLSSYETNFLIGLDLDRVGDIRRGEGHLDRHRQNDIDRTVAVFDDRDRLACHFIDSLGDE